MGREAIKGKQYFVGEVFSDKFVFSIPVYQRPYAWTTEEAGELFDDLLDFSGNHNKPVDELNPYFLGSIVLIKGEEKPDAQIVDGQQRLITLTILLAALRKVVSEDLRNEITSFILEKGSTLKKTKDRFRLNPRPRDIEFFRKYIQDEEGFDNLVNTHTSELSDSQVNFKQNAMLFLNKLKALDMSQRDRLVEFLINQCCLVVVSTPDLESAYRIFSVLNDRGMDLSYTDILKSDVIGALPSEQQEQYGNKWEDIEDFLGRDAFEDLFAHLRMIFRKSKLRGTIIKEVRESVQPAKNPTHFIDNTLIPFSEAYNIVINENFSSEHLAENVNRILVWLNRVDNFDWIPPAVLYMSKYNSEPEKLLTFFSDLERLASGLMVCRADINERINRYAKLIEAIENDEDLSVDESPLQLNNIDKSRVVNVLEGDIYPMKKIIRFVLLRLDSALSGEGATYEHDYISVEHVLPQSPPVDSQWMSWFLTEEERTYWVHKLANLVLLSRRKNSQAQNYEFEVKKSKYFRGKGGVAPFVLTIQVLQEETWNPETLSKRQEELINVFRSLWRL